MAEPVISEKGLLPGLKFEDENVPTPEPIPTPSPEPTPTPTPEPPIELIPKDETTPEPTPSPVPGTVNNEQEFLKSIFGEGHPYKSVDEVKALRLSERLTAAQKLEQEHVNATKAIENYKSRVSLMESPQFLSATKYANFVKDAGVEVDFGTFQKLEKFDPPAMDDLDAIVLLDYLKFQDKGRNHDLIKQQYKLGDYATETEDADGNSVRVESAFDRNAVGREAILAKKELSQLKQKIADFKPEFKDDSAEKASRQEQWKEAPEKMLPFFKTIDPPITEIRGIKVDASYQFTPEDHGKLKEIIQREINSRDLPLTQESVNIVYLSALREMKELKEEQRFRIFGEKLLAQKDMELKARYSNYTALDTTPPRQAPPETKARNDGSKTPTELAKEMIAERGRR